MSTRENSNYREFDRQAIFERPTETRNDSGEVEVTWAEIGRSWVSLQRQRLSERLKEPIVSDTIHSVRDYIMQVRSSTVVMLQLDLKDRAVINGTNYEIKDIPDDSERGIVANIAIRAGMSDG